MDSCLDEPGSKSPWNELRMREQVYIEEGYEESSLYVRLRNTSNMSKTRMETIDSNARS